ncbi:MAG: major coat protein [Massilia sp.]
MNKTKNLAAVVLGVALGGVATFASAAVDASVGTAFAAVQTDATAIAGIVTPIVVGILGLSLSIKLIKRFGSKI